jgi:hypothetical protein
VIARTGVATNEFGNKTSREKLYANDHGDKCNVKIGARRQALCDWMNQ